MPKRSTPTTEQVQAMIDAAPPGNGAPIKSGVSTSPAKEEKRVNFTTAFLAAPRVLLTTRNIYADVWVTKIYPSFFEWDNNSYAADVTVQWIATTAGNL